MALPDKETRDVSDVAVRATTLRELLRVTPRDTTFRSVIARDAELVVPRDVEPVVLRETTPRGDTLVVPATRLVVRATVAPDVPRLTVRPAARFVEFARGDAFDCVGATTGAIGSAKTARMDKNVEQTKKAPAKRNIVPTAFFATDAILRLFIHYSPADTNPTNPPF